MRGTVKLGEPPPAERLALSHPDGDARCAPWAWRAAA